VAEGAVPAPEDAAGQGAPAGRPASSGAEPGPAAREPALQPGLPQAADSYAAFYREFITHLVAFLIWQGASLGDAADLAQEAMIEAYRSWDAIEHPRAWTKRVASRKYARQITRVEPVEPARLALLLPAGFDIAEWEEDHEILRLLALLPPRQRQVMAWTYDGYSPSEVAAELNITAEAARASLMQARRALAAGLRKPGGKPGDDRT
jgi:RNA polymerase sigma factor (sigma-70 family)